MTHKLSELQRHLEDIYKSPNIASEIIEKLNNIYTPVETDITDTMWVSEKDVMLITYGDNIQSKNKPHFDTLFEFINNYIGELINTVHILPMFPYTSDDGFSVVDYTEIQHDLGDWHTLKKHSSNYYFMFDAVVNHISKSSDWFQKYLSGDDSYKNYFIEADENADYSLVTRPRDLPLLTKFKTFYGEKHLWTTFSEDQIDLNFKNPDVFFEIAKVLLLYAKNGARFIRLDAIGFAWKEQGTSCMHLKETHSLVKAMRAVLDVYAPGTIIITETNVPHKENISYFGNGYDEAGLVYQFALPPLVMFSYLAQDSSKIVDWAKKLEKTTDKTTFFNFLASHDGIGMRPIEDILSIDEKQLLVTKAVEHGGKVSYKVNSDKSKSPYELNISYQDALTGADECNENRILRMIGAHSILLSMQGVPGIYIHSLLGSRNDYIGLNSSNINRRINREKLDYAKLTKELSENENRNMILNSIKKMLKIRREHEAFSPLSSQEILDVKLPIFVIKRQSKQTKQIIYSITNFSVQSQEFAIENTMATDLLTGENIENSVKLKPLQTVWLLKTNSV